MKGLELNVTKQNGMTLVEYQLGVADVYDDRVSDKVAQLGNIIPFQYKDEDGKRSIVSYVHHDTSLEVMLRQTLKKADVLAILKGLLCAFEIGAAGVQICYLVRDLNYIYVDPESKAVKCIMVPVKQDPLGQSDIPDFFRNIVSHMRFDEADKDDYVARILTLINTDHYSNMKLKGLVDAEMEKLGLFYTRDEGLKKEADTTPAPEVQNQNVKVNRVGVMNNMRPQGMPAMGQPMGQPVPPMGGQPMMYQALGVDYAGHSDRTGCRYDRRCFIDSFIHVVFAKWPLAVRGWLPGRHHKKTLLRRPVSYLRKVRVYDPAEE